MLVDWVARKYLPLSFFEDDETQRLFTFLNKQAVLPGKNKLKSNVQSQFYKKQKAVITILSKNQSKVSFTIDGWTSIANQSYYGITGHFIDNDWNLRSLVIDFVPSNGKHTGQDIATLFYEVLEQFGLRKKIQGITVDNAAANTTFMEELSHLMNSADGEVFDPINQHFRCMAHIANLGIQDMLRLLKSGLQTEKDNDSFNEIDEDEIEEDNDNNDDSINEKCVLQNLRTLFKKLKYSEQLRNKLNACCETTNVKPMAPILDVSTRWNSTFEMIKSAVKMKQAINLLCENNANIQHLSITENDWQILCAVFKHLCIFKQLSDVLSGEKYVTLPLAVLTFNLLLNKIEQVIGDMNQKHDQSDIEYNIQTALVAVRDKLVKHYRKMNYIYCAVLILDPRHKVETFKYTDWGIEMEQMSLKTFENIYKEHYYYPEINILNLSQDEEESNTSDDDCINVNRLFKKGTSINLTNTAYYRNNLWKQEINHYLSAERADAKEDILQWWHQHEKVYPTLSRMARDFLATPATSVPAERLFSRAALIIRKHRNKLTKESARWLLCLNSWITCDLANYIHNFME